MTENTPGLTDAELDAQDGEQLPEREQMSLVNANLAAPINAAGAANVMFGSWLAGTYESAADTLRAPDGRLYKESFGMASNREVKSRNRSETAFELARTELLQEGG